MKIYINDFTKPVRAEILPSDTPTLDETLETFSFSLISTTSDQMYAPMQRVKVEFDDEGNDVAYFYIVSDSMDIFSTNPVKYKHNITVIQNTRKLSKHLVRNSAFTQPPQIQTKGYTHMTCCSMSQNISYTRASYTPTIKKFNLSNSHEKVSKTFVALKTYFGVTNHHSNTIGSNADCEWNTQLNTQDEITDFFSDSTFDFVDSLDLFYDLNGQTNIHDYITPQDLGLSEFEFNSTKECEKIKNLLNQGATNLYITLYLPEGEHPLGAGCPIQCSGPDTSQSDPGTYALFYVFHIEIYCETYYYNVYDILDLLIKRQRQTNFYNESKKEKLFYLPEWTNGADQKQDELYTLLKNTIAPNFTFTQLTMYECVAEVFRLFDAIFTLDENDVLGIEYFNDLSREEINPKITGKNMSLSEDKYTNGLISYYQDGRVKEVYPSNDCYAGLRSEGYGVPKDAHDHYFILPHNIDNIINAKVKILFKMPANSGSYTSQMVYQATMTNDVAVDITDRIIEESIWTLLSPEEIYSNTDKTSILQANTLYYVKGDNKIYCGLKEGSYYTLYDACLFSSYVFFGLETPTIMGIQFFIEITKPQDTNWYDYKMQVEYLTSVDGRIQIESISNKYEGETLVDQANGAVDINKLGLNILGLSLKLGEPTLNASHTITKWEKRIKTGQIYRYDNAIWVANVCSYTFLKSGVLQGKITFVKNFNALALRTQLWREKRLSNVSREMTLKSEDNYIDYIYYTTRGLDTIQNPTTIAYYIDELINGVVLSFYDNGSSHDEISFGTIKPITSLNHIYMPCIKYGAGNSICFEFSFDHPINAGNKTTYKTTSTWYGANKYFTSAVKYTDDNGFLDSCVFNLCTLKNYNFDESFPELVDINPTILMQIPLLQVYKQPNEVLALNYQLTFLPIEKEQDFIGSAFINYNFFTEGKKTIRSLRLYYSLDDFKYSVLDTEGHGSNYVDITSVSSYKVNSTTFTITFIHGNIDMTSVKSWAICDSDKKIIFASNNTSLIGVASTMKTIKFITSSKRN